MGFLRSSTLLVCTVLLSCNPSGDGVPPAYRDLTVSTERLEGSEVLQRGKARFAEHCAQCHGARADGHGPRRDSLTGIPTDFTSSSWRRAMTPQRAFWRIREGVPGTDMPSWKALDEEATWDLVAYVLSVAEGSPRAVGREP